MLYRKIGTEIEAHLTLGNDKILVVEGARQIGKSYIIREVGKRLYKNYVEINFAKDDETDGLFRDIHGLDKFYMTLSVVAGGKLGDKTDTLVFLDEIQHYPQYLSPVMKDEKSINLGAVYENVVAQDLKAHGHDLLYYDTNK